MRQHSLLLLLLVWNFACSTSPIDESGEGFERIITAGGTLTEIVYELGHGEAIIATDRTSTYPASMQALPSIGYRNQIKAEGVLALEGDIHLIEEGYLREEVVE